MTTLEERKLAQGDSTAISENNEESNQMPEIGDTSEISEKVAQVKEHDVIEEEMKQADKIQGELENELTENDGWVQILGNDQLTKKVTMKKFNYFLTSSNFVLLFSGYKGRNPQHEAFAWGSLYNQFQRVLERRRDCRIRLQ